LITKSGKYNDIIPENEQIIEIYELIRIVLITASQSLEIYVR